MSGAEARRKAEWFDEVASALGALCTGVTDLAAPRDVTRARSYWIPGRIEFLGKHTDYVGGRSLLCAIERGLCMVAAPRADSMVRVRDIRNAETIVTELDPDAEPAPGHWSNYVTAVARRIARDWPGAALGIDVAFASDLPPAAGMSSSSALIVGIFLALADANDLTARDEYRRTIPDDDALAGYLGAIESGRAYGAFSADGGVGTSGGSQDHTAILRSRPGALVQYAFAPVRFEEAVALPYRHSFVIASSGIQAEKAGAARDAYNKLTATVSALLDAWRLASGRDDQSLAAAVASSPDAAHQLRSWLRAATSGEFDAGTLVDRFEQFQMEAGVLVPGVAEALATDDLASVGTLVQLSQQCAERLLGNQIPETIALAASAREFGAVAASAFGAGFGGSVWALVPDEAAADFCERWMQDYRAAFPETTGCADFFVTCAGPPATRME